MLATVTIGGQLAQTNAYTAGYLTQIVDGTGKQLMAFAYNSVGTGGRTSRVDTPHGTIGFDYSSTRPACYGNTVLYFNRGSATSCSIDTDCGAGFLCGGTTGAGATGQCFRGARCLAVSSLSEDLVTTVTPLGPPSETCTGACTEVAQYIWDTSSGRLDLQATQDPAGTYVSRAYNANGLTTHISYGDADSTADPGVGTRDVYLFYGNSSFPGLVSESRRPSDIDASRSTCSAVDSKGCKRSVYTYTADGKPLTLTESGYTMSSTGAQVAYSYTTTWTHDTNGRLTQVDGPLAGSNDLTLFDYWATTDVTKNGFLRYYKRKVGTTYLVQEAAAYDLRGHPTTLIDADGTLSCQTFDAARGYLASVREAMGGQSTCTANALDLVTTYTRDAGLRLTQTVAPAGECTFYEYDTSGRLLSVKRRDDCNAASSGERMDLTYDFDGLMTKLEAFDATGAVTARREYTYFDSRRLEHVLNPVDPSKWTGFLYDSRGLVQEVDGAAGLGKTVLSTNVDRRVNAVTKYRSSTASDTWNLLYSWIGSSEKSTDGSSMAAESVRDDMNRIIKDVSADLSFPNIHVYDEAGRRILETESLGGTKPLTHNFTYDELGRSLTANFSGTCPTGAPSPPPEITRSFDVPPLACPAGVGCAYTAGRLAYVKTVLMCTATGSIDQETFYSYDPAGRIVREYIHDTTGRIADQSFAWTKDGGLAQVVTPSGATVGWTYGSATDNSDTRRVSALWRTSTSTPVVDQVKWFPMGSLKQYAQQNTIGGVALQTRISRNLAYRITDSRVETQGTATLIQGVAVTEDAKGRVTSRDYTPNTNGATDSFFLYDDADRLLCETTSLVGTCPTSGSSIKNSHTSSPPFTPGGDWKVLMRPIPGSTGLEHDFNSGMIPANHRVLTVGQPAGSTIYGDTVYSYDERGRRTSDDNTTTLTHDRRDYTYDGRGHLTSIQVPRLVLIGPPQTWATRTSSSGFDADDRRAIKMVSDSFSSAVSQWLYYYDPLGRLTEVQYTPTMATPSTYSIFQLFWLNDRLTGYWQTDLPSGTTSKRYVATDETGRPLGMWSWPASGDAAQVWAIAPSAWGGEAPTLGSNLYQPFGFGGQNIDRETVALTNTGTTAHRAALVIGSDKAYDPFVGGYLSPELFPTGGPPYLYRSGNPLPRTANGYGRNVIVQGNDGVYSCDDSSSGSESGSFGAGGIFETVAGGACTLLDDFGGAFGGSQPPRPPTQPPKPPPGGSTPGGTPGGTAPEDYSEGVCTAPDFADCREYEDRGDCRMCCDGIYDMHRIPRCNKKATPKERERCFAEANRDYGQCGHDCDHPGFLIATARVVSTCE